MLHLLGLDSRMLEVPGCKRLEIYHGQPITVGSGMSGRSPVVALARLVLVVLAAAVGGTNSAEPPGNKVELTRDLAAH
jgi:hypothetical protein